MKTCLIYDDRSLVSPEIASLLGIDRFSQVLYRKQSLLDHIRSLMRTVGIDEFLHLTRGDDLDALKRHLDRAAPGQRYLYFPASVVPERLDTARTFLSKIQFSRFDLIVPVDPPPHDPALAPVLLCGDRLLRDSLADIARQDFALLHRATRGEARSVRKVSHARLAPVEGGGVLRDISRYERFVEFLSSNFDVRHFNAIENDGLAVTKRSSDVNKMRREFRFLSMVDGPVQSFFLRPFDFKEEKNSAGAAKSASYRLERLNYPDMAIQWVHGALTLREFDSFLERLTRFFAMRPVSSINADAYADLTRKSYVDKTHARLQDLERQPAYAPLSAAIEHYTPYRSLRAMIDRWQQLADRILSKNRARITPQKAFTHGDLCFSNILYDKRIAQMKFIDPRGADTPEELYAHSYYDIAKVSHSVLGNYDFINHGLFDLVFTRDLSLSLEFAFPIDLARHKQAFLHRVEMMGFDPSIMRLFEASLFLSMLPLHIDIPKKTLAFALNAGLILDELEREHPASEQEMPIITILADLPRRIKLPNSLTR